MKSLGKIAVAGTFCVCLIAGLDCVLAQTGETLNEGVTSAAIQIKGSGNLRTYELTSTAELRDNKPADKRVTFSELAGHARVRTGNVLFDGLYAMVISEASENSVSQIKDGAYDNGAPLKLEAFQTGEFWTYVWTRDLAYSTHLALAGFDPERVINSLFFKTSVLKPSVEGGYGHQIIQDTGSGGSYPVSSDRVVWALGANETLKYLSGAEREDFLRRIYPILSETIEQDRRLVFDPEDGLYRGEQSFLDWREQTYPAWTKHNVLAIAMSKALSVNAADYFLLKTTAEYADFLGRKDEAARYAKWADALKGSINLHFYEPAAGLYSSYLLSDGVAAIPVHRYDLLGESLVILFGIADEARARAVLEHYPIGAFGPPVVWPQERTVPIYHNQAIWPFVTAYWLKAARKAGMAEIVDLGVHSLERLAALNLSNMENFDFVTGQAQVKGKELNGPVINSRRQLWSVAGYLAMVQDVVFGLETSYDGLRFRPFITAKLRNEVFGSSEELELQEFAFRNTRHHVRIHLPPRSQTTSGACAIGRVSLNRKEIGQGFVPADSLLPTNEWNIYLEGPPTLSKRGPLRMVNLSDEQSLFGPAQPVWDKAGSGITAEGGHLVLHYHHQDAGPVRFNIYRDGQLCAENISDTHWTDPESTDYLDNVHSYSIEAVEPLTGNVSHLSPSCSYRTPDQERIILAKDMENRGGKFVGAHHFEDWGKRDHELLTKTFRAERSGRYVIRAEFSNGSGPVNTGITCAVKKLEVRDNGANEVVAWGYLVMPQSGDWKRWDISSPVSAKLVVGKEYAIRICEDEYCRNMSYLKNNERYTAWPGGGEEPYNFVNISALHISLQKSYGLVTKPN
jgi:hypothetical protein